MSAMPAVSVIMVFHRDTPFLRPAIASLLAQTFRDFELILVDNGTHLSAEALGELGADERIRWLRLPGNAGIAAGHNAGVAAARGEFIALLDYDDLALPTRFSKQVAALRADSGLGLVSALADRIDEAGSVTGRMFTLTDPATFLAYSQYAAPIFLPASMGRRELFLAAPYRPEFPFAADLDFQSRINEHWRAVVIPEVLLHYRWYGAQTTQQKMPLIENSRCAISLITARRRAGRAENVAEVLGWAGALSPANYSRRIAGIALAEGFVELAAYRARRAFALERSLASAWAAFRLAWRAWRQALPAERGHVVRMFFKGPVRALA
ncbi:glycosyltransferase family 2 protein [Oleiharenicola lentus]|uniref:glycosyltransferase family 2 protein n=1 Tax=Oleiharenicola lentus TaxID=2508720 RepID=UPI003F678A23